MAEVGDYRFDNLDPRLPVDNRDLGAETELTITVGREQLTGVRRWARLIANPAPPGPHDLPYIEVSGKLYRMETEETWERVLGAEATATITWSYGSLSGTVAEDVPLLGQRHVTVPWTIPVALAGEHMTDDTFPVEFSAIITPRPESSGTFTWSNTVNIFRRPRVPLDVIPTLDEWGLTEGNEEIVEGAPFVPGSLLIANPVFVGTMGAPIASVETRLGATIVTNPAPDLDGNLRTWLNGGTPIPAEGLPLTTAGVFTVAALATDMRGRKFGTSTTVTVAEYTPPVLSMEAQRANPAGTPDPGGQYVIVQIATNVHFLGGLNSHEIRISTRPYGASVWELQETLTPSSTGYTGTILIDDVFDRLQSWDVQVEVQDAVTTLTHSMVVASTGQIINGVPGKLAIGRALDLNGPPLQLEGPARVYGAIEADNVIKARVKGVKPAGSTTLTVPLPEWADAPEVSLLVVDNTTNASQAIAWLQSLTPTQMVIRAASSSSVVHYTVAEYPWVPPPVLELVDEPVEFPTELSNTSVVFVGKVVPNSGSQYAFGNAQYAHLTGGAVTATTGTVWQLENDVLVAWLTNPSTVRSVGGWVAAGGLTHLWEGDFLAEAYPGVLPFEFMRQVTQRLANDLGVGVALGPQFDD